MLALETEKTAMSRKMSLNFLRDQMIGRYDDADATPILSFNIAHRDRILHPKFVTKLLNDLFGIQSRAGCSCAGPYGHILLDIDEGTSQEYREAILCGRQGLKPGWVRINLHYVFVRADLDFLLAAVGFVARHGEQFLRLYEFDFETGEWHAAGFNDPRPTFSATGGTPPPPSRLRNWDDCAPRISAGPKAKPGACAGWER